MNLSIEDIKDDGTLDTLVSTFDKNDGMIRDELSYEGPNLVTFAGILKYETFPLPSILKDILEIGHKAIGCPVEIEFAVNLQSAPMPLAAAYLGGQSVQRRIQAPPL